MTSKPAGCPEHCRLGQSQKQGPGAEKARMMQGALWVIARRQLIPRKVLQVHTQAQGTHTQTHTYSGHMHAQGASTGRAHTHSGHITHRMYAQGTYAQGHGAHACTRHTCPEHTHAQGHGAHTRTGHTRTACTGTCTRTHGCAQAPLTGQELKQRDSHTGCG